MYDKVTAQARAYRSLEPPPKPIHARVTASSAVLTTNGAISAGSLESAAIWYDVYHTYRPGTRTVHMRLVWQFGSFEQRFPLSEF